ncbi:LAQU0S02e04610g1_1 [Lachancea quebecensis]|uniref:Lysophospholipase n=1 Tax=Lachancea quebecensis TaxID=1654605 RepID=A0A0P1KQK2_9SACH|nr:LAQU0S02e04610g1_1 [Lachancea quebecensis]
MSLLGLEPYLTNFRSSLCDEETHYIDSRSELMRGKLEIYMRSLNARAADVERLVNISHQQINMGLAVSGGGYRSMLTGSGFLLGMREYGLVDCLNYITGVSGGSWILAKLISNGFDLDSLQNWDLERSLLGGVPDLDIPDGNVATMLESNNLSEIFRADKWFYDKLTQASGLWKRDAEPLPFAVFEEFYTELEQYAKFQSPNRLESRNPKPFSRITKAVARLFSSESGKEEQVNKLLNASNEFRQVVQTYVALHLKVKAKKFEGFPLSFTDYWGYALMNAIAPSTEPRSVSSLLDQSLVFQNFETPLPIFVANCKNKELKNAVFEFTPFEFGSWNSLGLFVKLRFLGSQIVAGQALKCFAGFDEVGFLAATSSSLFNNVLVYVWHLVAPSMDMRMAVRAIFSAFNLHGLKAEIGTASGGKEFSHPEYAIYQPNPFFRYPGKRNILAEQDQLYLVDGGEDGENIPIGPLLIEQRRLDVIFALDSSSDRGSFPNGSMLRNFYENHEVSSSGLDGPFNLLPYIPTSTEFVNEGLLSRPIAFGCHLESFPELYERSQGNFSSKPLPPIIIYHANSEHSFASNMSTFKLRYTAEEVQKMIQNGKDIFSFDSSPKYKRCLACIISKRSYDRATIYAEEARLPFFCEVCFSEYCYN